MDTLTHALSGALAARISAPANPREEQLTLRARSWAGFFAAAFPDTDFIARLFDPTSYLTVIHRGITHSVMMLPLWSLVLAAVFALLSRGRYSWRAFVGVSALGLAMHILGDVITAFGTMIFAPLSYVRVAIPTTFIIDPYFTAIVVAGLLGSIIVERFRAPALLGAAMLVAYVGMQAVLHDRAVRVGESYAAEKSLKGAVVRAIPQPLSPFNWMVVAEHEDIYHRAYISLLRDEPIDPPANTGFWRRLWASYQPASAAHWAVISRYGGGDSQALARAAWQAESLAGYRRFTLFPALYRVDANARGVCVWFEDLRFALEGRPMPFRYGACRSNGDSAWRLVRLLAPDHPELLDGVFDNEPQPKR